MPILLGAFIIIVILYLILRDTRARERRMMHKLSRKNDWD